MLAGMDAARQESPISVDGQKMQDLDELHHLIETRTGIQQILNMMEDMHDARHRIAYTLRGIFQQRLHRLHLRATQHLIAEYIHRKLNGDLTDMIALAVMLLPTMLHAMTHNAEIELADLLDRIAYDASCTGTILYKINLILCMSMHRESKTILRAVYYIQKITFR